MNENTPFNNETNPDSAVSVYGNNSSLNDFPVLQAFQKYIDAEQVKSQKRLTFVCVFFSLLIVFIVAVFLVLLINVSNSKSSMNDTFIRYLIDNKANAPAQSAPAVASNEVKILTDSISELRHQISAQQDKLIEQQLESIREKEKLLNSRLTAEMPVPTQSQVELAEMAKKNEKAQKELDAKLALLEKLNSELEQKKATIQKEQEALHKREVEFHRQRYAAEKGDTALQTPKPEQPKTTPQPKAAKTLPQVNPNGYISYYNEEEGPVPTPQPRANTQPTNKKPLPKTTKNGYISYFNDTETEAFYSDSKPVTRPKPTATKPVKKANSPSPSTKEPTSSAPASKPVAPVAKAEPEMKEFSVSTSEDGVEWAIPL